jgi:hypothetical protein
MGFSLLLRGLSFFNNLAHRHGQLEYFFGLVLDLLRCILGLLQQCFQQIGDSSDGLDAHPAGCIAKQPVFLLVSIRIGNVSARLLQRDAPFVSDSCVADLSAPPLAVVVVVAAHDDPG